MDLTPLAFDSPVDAYAAQARELLGAHQSGQDWAVRAFHTHHPRFLDDVYRWLPKRLPDSEIRDAALTLADAQLATARGYNFLDWEALTAHAAEASQPGSPVHRFEAAVEAVVNGQADELAAMLHAHPALVRERSTRVTHFDPPVHRATLMHYLAANGVENHRQRTPANAVAIARILLEAGAEPDALASLYGGEYATMSLLVSSSHPAGAGLQIPLLKILVDYGASVESTGSEQSGSPLLTALAFGYADTARALVHHGAQVNDVAAAAGLGLLEDTARLLPSASSHSRHCALALAAQLGQLEVTRLLLDAGEDPDRYNPAGFHAHATPLHHAALAGHSGVVRLLVERGARLDIQDKIYHSTPRGWAEYNEHGETAALLSSLHPASGISTQDYGETPNLNPAVSDVE